MIYIIALGILAGVTAIMLANDPPPKRDDLGGCIKIMNTNYPKKSAQLQHELVVTCLKVMKGE